MQCIPKISIKYDEETFFLTAFKIPTRPQNNYETAFIKGVKKKKNSDPLIGMLYLGFAIRQFKAARSKAHSPVCGQDPHLTFRNDRTQLNSAVMPGISSKMYKGINQKGI